MDADRTLVERVLRGDRFAFRELVHRHERLVWRLAGRMLLDVRDRDEVCQDIFLKVHRGLDAFEYKSKLATWIANIAYRTCLNRLNQRLEASRPLGDPDAAFENYIDDRAGVLQRLEVEAVHEAVRQGVNGLPPLQRAAVTLFYLEEMSLAEVATALEVPEGTVKSHLFRARKTLRGELAHVMEKEG